MNDNCQSWDPAKGPLRWDAERLSCPLPALLSITVEAAPRWLKPFLIFYISRELSNLQMQRAVAAPILTTAVYCGCRWRMNVLVLWGEPQPGWLRGSPHGVTGLPAGAALGVGVEGGEKGLGISTRTPSLASGLSREGGSPPAPLLSTDPLGKRMILSQC